MEAELKKLIVETLRNYYHPDISKARYVTRIIVKIVEGKEKESK